MEETDKIQNKQRVDVFKQLQNDKTFIRMHLLGKHFECLTIVTGVKEKDNTPFFLIDCPAGFKESAADVDTWRINFEFFGRDELKYFFRTSDGEIFGDEICIKFPESIERLQRRKHFRIKVPFGSKLHINEKPVHRAMNVIDVSLGGAFGARVSLEKTIQEDPLFEVGKNLSDLELVFPYEDEDLIVHVNTAMVIRLGKNPETKIESCAFQFTDIEKIEENILKEFIYWFQRDLLRKNR